MIRLYMYIAPSRRSSFWGSLGHVLTPSTVEKFSLGLSSFFSWLTERICIQFPRLSAKMFRVLPLDKTPDFRYTWGAPSLIILFHTSKETCPHLRSWYATWKDDSMQYVVIGLHPCGMNKPNTYGSCRNNLDIPSSQPSRNYEGTDVGAWKYLSKLRFKMATHRERTISSST